MATLYSISCDGTPMNNQRRTILLTDLLVQTLICSGDKILGIHTRSWVVDQFFWELAQIPQGALFKAVEALEGNNRGKLSNLVQRVDKLDMHLAKVFQNC
jgi:hypothetical protein